MKWTTCQSLFGKGLPHKEPHMNKARHIRGGEKFPENDGARLLRNG